MDRPDSQRLRRGVAVGLLVAVLVLLVALIGPARPGRSDYSVRVLSVNAGQLVRGNVVRVGGVAVGKVTDLRLDDHNRAEIVLRIDDGDLAPLHRGTRATIRSPSLGAIAGREVVLEPGPNNAPEIPSGGFIPTSDTQSTVEIDQLINTLDAEVRSRLQEIVHGSATIYARDTAAARRGLRALSPALDQSARTLEQLLRDQPAFERFVVEAASVAGAVAERSGALESGLVHGAAVADELADEAAALDALLRRSPATLRRAASTLAGLRAGLADLRPALREAQPVAPRLAQLLRTLAPVTRKAIPAVRDLRALAPSLAAVLRGLPQLDRTARPAFASTSESLRGADAIVQAARAYTPDLIAGLFNGFGGTTGGSYDANGHYVRVAFAGNAFTLFHQSLSPVPLPPRPNALLNGYRTGVTRRCPGAATQPAPDGSNPWAPPGVPCRVEDTLR